MTAHFAHPDDLGSSAALEDLFGPIRSVERTPLTTIGFSGARLERLTVCTAGGETLRLVLKRFTLAASWTAYRTGDTVGREAALPMEPALAAVWGAYRNPYRAVARHDGAVGLLLDDLTEWLPADGVRLDEEREEAFLRALATLHATTWGWDARWVAWLAPPAARFHILHPSAGREELRRPGAAPVFTLVRRGWDLALAALPPRVAAYLQRPPEETAHEFAHLPASLLHGDSKVANFAFLPDGAVAAFDWATMGYGSPALDLGYCLAINAAAFPSGRAHLLARYRALLEGGLGRPLPAGVWDEMTALAVVAGAAMLLWSKALARAEGAPGADREWDWWAGELESRIT